MSLGSVSRSACARGGRVVMVFLTLLFCAPALAQCLGTRYVSLGGSDAGNECAGSGTPCRTIQHAIDVACAGEQVNVATGDYSEDIVIDHAVQVNGPPEGPIGLHITGSGTQDVVRILASNVIWSGMTVWNTPGVAGIRVGDAAHPGVRGVILQNATSRNNGIGFLFENTGIDGAYNILAGAIARNSVAGAPPGTGTGLLFVGGNGRVQLFSALVHHNDGAGLRIDAPPAGAANTRFVIVSSQFYDNGQAPGAGGAVGLEAHAVADLTLEGNEFFGHTGPTPGDDGRAVVLDGVDGGGAYCNSVHGNDGGFVLSGGTAHFALQSGGFNANSGTAVTVDASSIAGNAIHETVFQGNGAALAVSGAAPLDASHNWWGAASGPSGAFPGSGDAATGPASIAPLVASAQTPVLARIRTDGNWDYGTSSCHPGLQEAIDAAAPGGFVLVGTGPFYEHVVVTKPLTIEGIPGGGACSPSAVDGVQNSSPNRPTLRVAGVSGLVLRNLTLQGAQHGTACGSDSGDEIGLDMRDVTSSTVQDVCLRGNGITELRLYGNSDGNLLQNLDIDGTATPYGGQGCDHLSHEGVLIDGGPVCEGGAGASADGNRFENTKIRGVTRGVRVRLATGTVLTGGSIQAQSRPEWQGGALSLGVEIEAADGTRVQGLQIGNAGMIEAVRVAGRPASACYALPNDSHDTLVDGNQLRTSDGPAVHVFRVAGDPGAAPGTIVSCNDIYQNGTGVLVDDTGAGAGTPVSVLHNDVHANGVGANNAAGGALAATANWWGAASGPSGAGPGGGDSVTAGVVYAPFLTLPATQDQDGDGFSTCQADCNEADASVHPGAVDLCNGADDDCDGSRDEDFVGGSTSCGVGACAATGSVVCADGQPLDSCTPGAPSAELCNGIDDDCDGRVDNAAPPAGTPTLDATRHAGSATADLTWTPLGGATGYDLVRGDVGALLASGGHFEQTALTCLGSQLAGLAAADADLPATGDAFWYLVRGDDCGGAGSFDGAGPGLARSRDAGIGGAAGSCPFP